jgi:cytosine/adenosine deaminase-related metal-dependent hydrolase
VIITGDWVLPVSRAPIRYGAVLGAGHSIVEVGLREEICTAHPDVRVHEHPGCAILPGLVNAHTHLSLTAMHDLLPSMPFAEWIGRITPAVLALGPDDFADSAAWGALACLATGATVVGDITYGPEDLSVAGDLGLGGVFFWEVLGKQPKDLGNALARQEFPPDTHDSSFGRLRPGVSPHSPYTSGPELLQATSAFAKTKGVPVMIHLAESQEETSLLDSGSGPLAAIAARLAEGFLPPRMGAVAYADALGVLEGAIAVHCVHLFKGEPTLLATRARGVVLCPRSNRYLLNGEPPIASLRQHGVKMALGTDSLASNQDMDLFAEARVAREIDPDLSAKRVLRMLTVEAAEILGLDGLFGTLEPGKQADLIAVEIGDTQHPTERVIEGGSPGRVQAVMSFGAWRVLGGRSTVLPTPLERANARVATKAARALGIRKKT